MLDQERDDDIVEWASRGWTLRQLGQRFGLSKERIRQILASYGLTTLLFRQGGAADQPVAQCAYCGAPIRRRQGVGRAPRWGHCCGRPVCRRAWARACYRQSADVRARHHEQMLASAQRRYGPSHCQRCGQPVLTTRPDARHLCWPCRGRGRVRTAGEQPAAPRNDYSLPQNIGTQNPRLFVRGMR